MHFLLAKGVHLWYIGATTIVLRGLPRSEANIKYSANLVAKEFAECNKFRWQITIMVIFAV